MGNYLEIDLSKYGCNCFDQEDSGYLDFFTDTTNKENPTINNNKLEEKYRNQSKTNLYENTQPTTSKKGLHSKKYESITVFLNNNIDDNLNIDKLREENTQNSKENEVTLFNDKNYLKEFEYSETEINSSNFENDKSNKNEDVDEEEQDIDNVNSNTDYYQLAKQIAESIKELKNNIFNCGTKNVSIYTPNPKFSNEENFENAIKRAGKIADTICFNDVIGCIKKISDINSEVTLTKEKIYIGIVNKFKRKYSLTHFINFNEEEKIVEIPNFDGIKYEIKKKLGKFNNPKFQFHKFTLRGSFPNEILIWKLISQNMEKIRDIIKNNYYCSAILLHKGKNEQENETIIYMINKL